MFWVTLNAIEATKLALERVRYSELAFRNQLEMPSWNPRDRILVVGVDLPLIRKSTKKALCSLPNPYTASLSKRLLNPSPERIRENMEAEANAEERNFASQAPKDNTLCQRQARWAL